MKRHFGLLTLAVFLGIFGSLWGFMYAQAQTDAFTFFIPYHPNDLNDQFNVTWSECGFRLSETGDWLFVGSKGLSLGRSMQCINSSGKIVVSAKSTKRRFMYVSIIP